MSYSILYQDDGGVITTYSGVFTDDELLQSARERTTPIERVDSYRYLLSDFTDVTDFKISTEAIRDVAVLTDRMTQRNPRIQVALVLPTDVEYGTGRMWQSLAKDGDRRAVVVRSMEEAVTWLEHDFGRA